MSKYRDIPDRIWQGAAMGALHLLAFMPLWVLYRLSDILFVILLATGYRRKVVRHNLAASFPAKSERELRRIERQFYRNFADYIVETVKLLHISDKEMRRRMVFDGVEIADEYLREGRAVVAYFSHMGNWEWASSFPLWSALRDNADVAFCQIYRPLRNQWFDRLMLKIRSRFGARSLPKQTAFLDLLRLRKQGKATITGFMSDQKPSHGDPGHVTMFLNHPTAFITGTATVARRMKAPVLYWQMTKPSRGHYRVAIRLITPDASALTEASLTATYASLLEADINASPSLWLWTHKRWKRPVTLPASIPETERQPG